MTLNPPNQRGTFQFKAITYAAPGLQYPATVQQQYRIFEDVMPAFETKFVDLSAFVSQLTDVSWPFDNSRCPINGLVRIPEGAGPFPVIIFAHGNHSPSVNSTPGYLYLCDLLATHGFIAATIDANFLNGGNFGENDARAIVHLEHVKQFREWNLQAGHPLQSKVDINNVMIVGHSRGGEGVGHASYFNTLDSIQFDTFSPPVALDGSSGLGPYHFDIKAVVAIAPTDGQYVALNGPVNIEDNYFLIHGSRDGDVWPFPGQKTYDRSITSQHLSKQTNERNRDKKHADQLHINSFKSLLWVHGANHNYFNSVWDKEPRAPNGISRAEQELVISVYISALAYVTLKNQTEYQSLFMNHRVAYEQGWIPLSQKLVSQFFDHSSFSLQDNENSSNVPILNQNVTGSVETVGIDYELLDMDLGVRHHLFQETRGLRIDWLQANASYVVNINPDTLLTEKYTHISFRIGQSYERNNAAGIDQDFNIELSDGENTGNLQASDLTDLIFPDASTIGEFVEPKTVMQSLFIPLKETEHFKTGLDEIKQIKLNFNVTGQGTLYMDDLVLIAKGEHSDGDK